ncbi:MAG TPA: hypothetical protein VFU05_17460 [Cyclobacteriaceae bacterium]|nr:hypothetical protein [Cyclobacteriaceae bacterium]
MDHFNRTEIRMSFEAVLDKLVTSLQREGFVISGITDFHEFNSKSEIAHGKYKVLSVYLPALYKELMTLCPYDGAILPSYVSVIETYPGQISVVPYSPDGTIIEMQNGSFQSLRAEVAKRLNLAVSALEPKQVKDPDLVTSWS